MATKTTTAKYHACWMPYDERRFESRCYLVLEYERNDPSNPLCPNCARELRNPRPNRASRHYLTAAELGL